MLLLHMFKSYCTSLHLYSNTIHINYSLGQDLNCVREFGFILHSVVYINNPVFFFGGGGQGVGCGCMVCLLMNDSGIME